MGLIEQIVKAGSAAAEYFAKDEPDAITGGYMLQQNPKEFAGLIAMLRNFAPFHTALSIGIAAGGTERFLVETVDIHQLVIMDDGKHHDFRVWRDSKGNRAAIAERIPLHEHIGNSHAKAAAKFLEELGFKYNLVGIDGDHSPAGVRKDWEMVKPHLAPGAIVWFHDIACEEPGQTGAAELWFELRRRHPVIYESRARGLGIGALKV